MTKAEYATEHNGDRERIGRVVTQPSDGCKLLVETEDWEPSTSDMFIVDGAHTLNPVTGDDTGFDCGFSVDKVIDNVDGVAHLDVFPRMITTGPFRTIASLPAAGAVIYRPAGDHLRAIYEWWLDHNR